MDFYNFSNAHFDVYNVYLYCLFYLFIFLYFLKIRVVWDLIKQIGQNLTNGTSLTSITLPITISEPRSYLEMVADGWCYAPLFLKQAAVEADPVERMKMVITFAVAGLSNTCVVKKPFNPIVGKF